MSITVSSQICVPRYSRYWNERSRTQTCICKGACYLNETEFKSTANTHAFKSRKDAGETVKAQLPRGLLSNKIQHNVPIAERFPAHTSLCKYHTWGIGHKPSLSSNLYSAINQLANLKHLTLKKPPKPQTSRLPKTMPPQGTKRTKDRKKPQHLHSG